MVIKALHLLKCGSVCEVKGRRIWLGREGSDGGPAHIVKTDTWLSSAGHIQFDAVELMMLPLHLLVSLSTQLKGVYVLTNIDKFVWAMCKKAGMQQFLGKTLELW